MNNRKRNIARISFLVCAALIFVFLRAALYDGLTVSSYTVKSPAVTASHTFAVITDLHSTYYGENQSELCEMIAEYSPEAIFFVGDIAEDKRNFEGTAALLEQIAHLYPCYYVAGNHERWVDYTDDIFALFSEYGVITIGEKTVDLGDGILLHGIDDPSFYKSTDEFLTLLSSIETSDNSLDILLSHRPEFAEQYAALGFDLTLCGHAHGGQVRLPFITGGLYAPHQGLFPKYACGRYDFDNSTVIVSRGLMRDELPRVFNPPELVILTVTPE
ncbi:MAG: metallophosphoesterase family protein [Clostridia bacterium]|nr:metallophosphoesterase family protein [Clostridia bacterium]